MDKDYNIEFYSLYINKDGKEYIIIRIDYEQRVITSTQRYVDIENRSIIERARPCCIFHNGKLISSKNARRKALTKSSYEEDMVFIEKLVTWDMVKNDIIDKINKIGPGDWTF